MAQEINQPRLKSWIAWLREGHPQTKVYLKIVDKNDREAWCALGGLCELASRDMPDTLTQIVEEKVWRKDGARLVGFFTGKIDKNYHADAKYVMAPSSVVSWLLGSDEQSDLRVRILSTTSLYNDRGKSFAKVADYLETFVKID